MRRARVLRLCAIHLSISGRSVPHIEAVDRRSLHTGASDLLWWMRLVWRRLQHARLPPGAAFTSRLGCKRYVEVRGVSADASDLTPVVLGASANVADPSQLGQGCVVQI